METDNISKIVDIILYIVFIIGLIITTCIYVIEIRNNTKLNSENEIKKSIIRRNLK